MKNSLRHLRLTHFFHLSSLFKPPALLSLSPSLWKASVPILLRRQMLLQEITCPCFPITSENQGTYLPLCCWPFLLVPGYSLCCHPKPTLQTDGYFLSGSITNVLFLLDHAHQPINMLPLLPERKFYFEPSSVLSISVVSSDF